MHQAILVALLGMVAVAAAAATPKQNIRVHLLVGNWYQPSTTTGGKGKGLAQDLLDELEKRANVKFTVTARKDLGYPSRTDGSFKGSPLQSLLNKDAELVGTDLTMTAAGEEVVSFLHPFNRYELRIVQNSNGINDDTKWVIANTEDLDYLRRSTNDTLKTIYNQINGNKDDQIVKSDEEGAQKVLNGNYAYIIENLNWPALQAKYGSQLTLAPQPNNLGGYFFNAFAVQQGSPLRKLLNVPILAMKEDGTMKTLMQKYNMYNCVQDTLSGNSASDASSDSSSSMQSSDSSSSSGSMAAPRALPTGGSKNVQNVRVEMLVGNWFTAPTGGSKKGSGMAQDILDELEKRANVKFTVVPRPELTYPSRVDGTFKNSVLQSLLDKKADLVGSDLTETAAGEAVVDFLHPFMRYELRILVNPNNGIDQDTKWVIANTEDLDYLRSSKNATLKTIYDQINANKDDQVVSSDDDGIQKVLNGNYAYIIESNHWPAMRDKYNGQVAILPQPNSLGGYFFDTFAVQKDSALRHTLNSAILAMKEDGSMKTLLQKYNMYDCIA